MSEDAIEDLKHLNGHETSPLPCLCKRCFLADRVRVEVGGVVFLRSHAIAHGRILYYWMPATLEDQQQEVRRAVSARMEAMLRGLA